MGNISEITEYACSGCGACVAVCPQKAIGLQLNRRGFFEAVVDDDRCIHCGICRSSCTRFDAALSGKDIRSSTLYAVQSEDKDTVKRCSSGGAAHEIAEWALSRGYQICGAVYDCATDMVNHRIMNESGKLDGSKYLQSNTVVFRDVLQLAEQGEKIAVFGTPCQIAGLEKASQQKKVRDRLLLVEIFCHGVPSYKLWEKECQRMRKKLHSKSFDSVHFRYKKDGWHSYCLRFEANGKVCYGSREGDLFYRAFFDDVFLNDSCMNCRMRKEQSSADIRLGDYWGKRYATRDDGVSAVFCNTLLGEQVISECAFIKMEPGTTDEQLTCQNMQGYSCQELQHQTMQVLEKNGIDTAIHFYKAKLPMKRKVKNLALSISVVIPDALRAKIRRIR